MQAMLVRVITAYVTKGSGADGTPGNSEADATAARTTGSELTTLGVPGCQAGGGGHAGVSSTGTSAPRGRACTPRLTTRTRKPPLSSCDFFFLAHPLAVLSLFELT